MNEFSRIVNITTKVNVFLAALDSQKEEQRLFQFLNGLDENYASQRSQLLLISPFLSVESVCALLQQEESHRGVFGNVSQLGIETTTLYTKTETKEKCYICGYKWHPTNKCKATGTSRSAPPKRIAAAVESRSVLFTSKQFEQLMKSLPHFNAQNFNKGGDSNEELDPHFAVALEDCSLFGHVSDSTLKHMLCIPNVSKTSANTGLSCPMTKFTKLSFPISESHCKVAFHMIHIDIWGPYKVPTLGHNRYFLTIVDDFSRGV
ncbi:hypothetical protein Tco_1478977 [Tanacetum coccineum]